LNRFSKYLSYAAYVLQYRTLSKRKIRERRWSEYRRKPPEFVQTLEGFYLYLSHDKEVSFRIAITGTYTDVGDRYITPLFKKLANGSSLVVDVGANIGWFTFLAAKGAKRVVAFEPEPRNLALLERSKQKNRCQNVEIMGRAISDNVGSVTLSVSDNPGHHSIVRKVGDAEMQVPATTLDAAFPTETIDLLKIDAEGAEALALRGAARLIAERRIKAVIMEWNVEVWDDITPLEGFELFKTDGEALKRNQLPKGLCNLYLRPSS